MKSEKNEKRKYPDLFYNYAFSGQAKCNECKNLLKKEHWVFVFQGNIYHDICSQKFEGREKLKRE